MKQFKTHLFMKIIITYFCVILLLFLFLIPVSHGVIQSERRKVLQNYTAYAKAGFEHIESTFDNMEMLAVNLCHDSNIQKVANMDTNFKVKESYVLIEAGNYIKSSVLFMADMIKEVYVTFGNNEIIITDSAIHTSRKFYYDKFMRYDALDFKSWEEKLRNPKSNFWGSTISGFNGEKTNVLAVQIPAANATGNFKSCSVIANISTKQLIEELLEPGIIKDCFVQIEGPEDNIIYTYQMDSEGVSNPEDGQTIQYQGKDIELVVFEQDTYGLRFIIGIPQSILSQGESPLQNLIYLYGTIATFSAILLSLFFAYMNYYPMKKLLAFLSPFHKEDGERREDVYEMIRNTVMELQNTNQNALVEIDAIKKSVKENYFERLLQGWIYKSSDIEQCHNLFRFITRSYYVVLADYRFYDSKDSEINLDMVMLLTKKVFEQFFEHNVYVSFTTEKLVALIQRKEDEFEENDRIRANEERQEQLKTIHSVLSESLDCQIFLHVSSWYDDIMDMDKAYEQVKLYSELLTNEETGEVVYCSELSKDTEVTVIDSLTLKKLKELILLGEETKVIQIYQEIYQEIRPKERVGQTDYRQIFYDLRGILLQVMNRIGTLNVTVIIPNYQETLGFHDQYNQLIQASISICEAMHVHKKSHNNELREQVLGYIQDNFGDSNLSMVFLADHFNVSEKYISHFIKEQTGKNYMEHIMDLRLGAAEKYLRETDKSVEDLSALVGFANRNSFYKAFKKRYGVSPTEYRISYTSMHGTI